MMRSELEGKSFLEKQLDQRIKSCRSGCVDAKSSSEEPETIPRAVARLVLVGRTGAEFCKLMAQVCSLLTIPFMMLMLLHVSLWVILAPVLGAMLFCWLGIMLWLVPASIASLFDPAEKGQTKQRWHVYAWMALPLPVLFTVSILTAVPASAVLYAEGLQNVLAIFLVTFTFVSAVLGAVATYVNGLVFRKDFAIVKKYLVSSGIVFGSLVVWLVTVFLWYHQFSRSH